MPRFPSKKAPQDLTQFSQSPSASLSYFPEFHQWSEISSLPKVILVLGKGRGWGCQIWAEGELSHLGDLMFHKKTLHETWYMRKCVIVMKLPMPRAAAFWSIQIVSVEECSSLMQYLMQIHCSIHSVILNAMTTQYTCSFNGTYSPHWLVQCSCHCSCMWIPVHSPGLPVYVNVLQSIFIILTMAVLFLNKLCMYYLYIYLYYR